MIAADRRRNQRSVPGSHIHKDTRGIKTGKQDMEVHDKLAENTGKEGRQLDTGVAHFHKVRR